MLTVSPLRRFLDRYRLGRSVEQDERHFLGGAPLPTSLFRHQQDPFEGGLPPLRQKPTDLVRYHGDLQAAQRAKAAGRRFEYPAPPQAGDCFIDAALPDHEAFGRIGRSIVRHRPVGSDATGWTSTLVNSLDRNGRPTGRLFLLTAAHVLNGSWNWPGAPTGRHHLELAFGFRNRIPNDPATSQEPSPKLKIQRWVMPRMVGVYFGTTLWPHRDVILVEIEGGAEAIPEHIWEETGLQYAGWSLHPPRFSPHAAKNPCAVVGHGGGWPQHLARGGGDWTEVSYRDGFYLRTPDLTTGRLIVGHSGSPMVGLDNRVVAVARTGGSACASGRFRASGASLAANWTVNPHNLPGATLLDLLAGGNPEVTSCNAYRP